MTIKPCPNPRNNMWDLIANHLRFYRGTMKGKGPKVTEILNISEATLSRIELGYRRLGGDEAAKIDKAWHTGDIFGHLVWYAALGHDPEWFAQYLHLEDQADVISTFQAQVIPGLLQTEDYARCLLECADLSQVDVLLRERIERQLILARDRPPHLSITLSQNVLEWPIGSPEIMRDQLARLLDVTKQSNYVIRVVPRTWETGAYQGLDGSFSRMSGEFGEAVYTESPGGGRLVSTPAEVRGYAVRYDRIAGKALPEGASRNLIKKVMEAFQ
ncbi:hypothetical protein BTM25_11560 [Actinomadura rubteroloni]|uniref:DUF5753 domain-containing protein n=1 Tax=Actinomadura rubteroloni TaxID=1926885 RepID=A0A2P4UNW9_9ACTN|nr:DUF5753 domain-containing protein [Actinomadura rubteroloni]POM26750.1 hypothetical protein BTM25_11560 [Actinomadura rubteroloni]